VASGCAQGVEIIEIDITPFHNQAKQFYSLPDFTSQWSPGLFDAVSRAKAVN
jgi:hypothetical protein